MPETVTYMRDSETLFCGDCEAFCSGKSETELFRRHRDIEIVLLGFFFLDDCVYVARNTNFLTLVGAQKCSAILLTKFILCFFLHSNLNVRGNFLL